MSIDNMTLMTRRRFLSDRRRAVEEAKLLQQAYEIAGLFDGGDDIICDWCNESIENLIIMVVNDENVLCEHCLCQKMEQEDCDHGD